MRKMGIIKTLENIADDDSESEITPKQTTTGAKSKGAGTTFEMRLMRVRKNATVRERRRLAEVNRAYTELSRQVPQQLLGNATKLEVLRGAAQYIHMLMVMLGRSDDVIYDAPISATDRQDDENTMSEWCSLERRELNNNMLDNGGVMSAGNGTSVITSVSSSANDENNPSNARPHALAPVNGVFSYSPTSVPSGGDTGLSKESVSNSGTAEPVDEQQQIDEFTFVQSGILKMDDPPPKANISWR